jgi:repressor LexA
VRLPEGYGWQLPLAGIVSAGKPIEAIETPDTIAVPFSMADEGNFVLRVEGDSMVEDGILNGDYVVVHRQPHAERGQTVVALMDNEATVKRFYRMRDRIELRPANSAMEPIIVQDNETFRIVGIVVGVIRHLK